MVCSASNTNPIQIEKAHNTGIQPANRCELWKSCFVIGGRILPGDGVLPYIFDIWAIFLYLSDTWIIVIAAEEIRGFDDGH